MNTQKKDQTDKTDQKEHLQNIAQLIDKNQELEKKYTLLSTKEEFLENHLQKLKHDLQSPLGGIIGMLDLMSNEDKDQVEVQTQDLTMIKESAQALLDLVNDTFVIRGIQQGEKESMNMDRKLSSAMKEIHHLYLPMAKNKGIKLSLSAQIETEIELQLNLFLNLIQITGNLIANAIKFTPPKGSVKVDFELDAEEDRSILKVTVTDTGEGMNPDQVSAFNQAKSVERSAGTNGEPGSGIGLLHVMEMVCEVDGHISVKSEKGSGTTFSLTFPLPGIHLNQKSAYPFVKKFRSIFLNGSPA